MRLICLRLGALGAALLLLAGGLWPFPVISKPIFLVSGIILIGAAILRAKIWYEAKTDVYSLSCLNQLVREGSFEEAEVPEVDHEGDKYCLCCHTSYGSQFGVCPNCAKK